MQKKVTSVLSYLMVKGGNGVFGKGKLLERSRLIGYDITLRGNIKTPEENAEEKTKEDAILKKLNKNTYNVLYLEQYAKFCLHIVEELATKDLPNESALRAWDSLNKKFQQISGAFKARLLNKFAKS